MKSKRSRIALVGVLALAISVTVGLVSGSVAEAKKKKGGAKSVTTIGAPTGIPVSASNNAPAGVANVPMVVGNKAKGKVVGWDSVAITTTYTGSTNTALGSIFSELIAPNGRTVFLVTPVFNTAANPGQGNQTAGPTTETPDSFVNPCFPATAPSQPCPGGANRDPDALLGPPYAGTIQNGTLSHLGGVPAKGAWTLRLFNTSTTTTATLNAVSLTMTLRKAPPA